MIRRMLVTLGAVTLALSTVSFAGCAGSRNQHPGKSIARRFTFLLYMCAFVPSAD